MRVVSVLGGVYVWAALAGFAGLAGAEFIGLAAALRGDVVRVSAVKGETSVGQLFSGRKIFLGDEIDVASRGRMQIMLVDETVFTLGNGARLVIDKFVYDPASQTESMTTNITKGAFRFVSGKQAKSSPKAMKVTLPTASLSIRSKKVGGIVEEDGASQVVLVGAELNNFGASHQEKRGRKYEYLTSGTTSVFTGALMKLGSLRLLPNARILETLSKTSSDSNVISGGVTAGHSLPFGLQSYFSAKHSIINRVSSCAFTTADQNDGHSRD